MIPKHIILSLIDGTPRGLRKASVVSSKGFAIAGVRQDLKRMLQLQEAKGKGVYLLMGKEDLPESDDSAEKLYVGQADDVAARLRAHAGEKDLTKKFWQKVVVFSAGNDEISRTHIQFLEQAVLEIAQQGKLFDVTNKNTPKKEILSDIDHAHVFAFLDNLLTLLPVLGVDIQGYVANPLLEHAERLPDSSIFELKIRQAFAQMRQDDEGFVILKESTACKTDRNSLPRMALQERNRLREKGILSPHQANENLLVFQQDYKAKSLSLAASIVSGISLSGPEAWKQKGSALTFAEWEKSKESDLVK